MQWHSVPFLAAGGANLNIVKAMRWKNNAYTCLRSYSLPLNYLLTHLLMNAVYVCVLFINLLLSNREFPAQGVLKHFF